MDSKIWLTSKWKRKAWPVFGYLAFAVFACVRVLKEKLVVFLFLDLKLLKHRVDLGPSEIVTRRQEKE